MATINIIGAGPTGVTIGWELAAAGHEVHIWEKNDTCGGSWWEPDGVRNMHAPRVLFKHAYGNFRSLLCEMGLQWDKYFIKSDTIEKNMQTAFKYLNFKDYLTLSKLIISAKSDKKWASNTTLKNELNTSISESGKKLLSVLPIAIDGVPWDRMTVWEFVDSIDTTALSTAYTQGVSGRELGVDMECALRRRGVVFHFGEELVNIDYNEDTYIGLFKSGKTIGEGKFILAIDPGPAKRFVKDNWGARAKPTLDTITYGCVNVMLWYKEPPKIETDIGALTANGGKILPIWEENDILSCTIYHECDIPRDQLVTWVCDTLGVPLPDDSIICWGSEWNGKTWDHTQTSGIYTPNPIPFTGRCPNVHMVGMMSPRRTTFASIESAVEVGRAFTRGMYGCTGPIYKTNMSYKLTIILTVIFLALIL